MSLPLTINLQFACVSLFSILSDGSELDEEVEDISSLDCVNEVVSVNAFCSDALSETLSVGCVDESIDTLLSVGEADVISPEQPVVIHKMTHKSKTKENFIHNKPHFL